MRTPLPPFLLRKRNNEGRTTTKANAARAEANARGPEANNRPSPRPTSQARGADPPPPLDTEKTTKLRKLLRTPYRPPQMRKGATTNANHD